LRLSHNETYLIFGDIEGKLDVLRVECRKCGRKGRYQVHKLIAKCGRNGNPLTRAAISLPPVAWLM
jgi:ribosomal protein L37E